MLTQKKRSYPVVFLFAIAAGMMVAGAGILSVAQAPVPVPAPGGPFFVKQQNDAVGQCDGNWVQHSSMVCDSLQPCNPIHRCATVSTPCGALTYARRHTVNSIMFGFCQAAYSNRQCSDCPNDMICEIIRGYKGLDISGNCAMGCDTRYKKVVQNACLP